MPPSPRRVAAGKARQRIYATSANGAPNLKSRHHTASMDFGEIAVDKAFLRSFHLAPIDVLGAGVVAVRQELALDGGRQRNRARRAQIGIGPDRLALVGQQVVDNLLGL